MKTFRQYINDTEETVLIPGAYMVPRSQMPQIPNQKDFTIFLKLNGVRYVETEHTLQDLTPLQSFVVRSKVKRFSEKEIYKHPIIISKDNFILDGHHRYFAALERKLDKVKTLQVLLNINELFQLTQEYEEYVRSRAEKYNYPTYRRDVRQS